MAHDNSGRHDRVFYVLQAVATASEPIPGIEVARQIGAPVSTTAVILKNLVSCGAISRSADGYQCGPAMTLLSERVVERWGVRHLIRPHLTRLAEELRRDVYLAHRHGDHMRLADHISGPEPLQVRANGALEYPLNITAVGHVLLAFGSGDLPGGLSDSEKTHLRDAVASVKEQGYARTQEAIAGVMGLAVPVIAGDRYLGYALNVLCAAPASEEEILYAVGRMQSTVRDIGLEVAKHSSAPAPCPAVKPI